MSYQHLSNAIINRVENTTDTDVLRKELITILDIHNRTPYFKEENFEKILLFSNRLVELQYK